MRATFADYRARASELAAVDVIFDAPRKLRSGARKDKLELERHFNDLYAVFLHKLSAFTLQREASAQERKRLRIFFEALLNAKEVLGRE